MKIDLRNSFNEGMILLQSWRNRYTPLEYPEKVLLNLFYRKYTMEFMWDEINGNFQNNPFGGRKVFWSDFNVGYEKLKISYQQNAISKTQPILLELLSEQSNRYVGGTSYAAFIDRIAGARQGNRDDIEEIEYAYLYYLLADDVFYYGVHLEEQV